MGWKDVKDTLNRISFSRKLCRNVRWVFSSGNDHVEIHRALFGLILQFVRNLKPFAAFKWKSRENLLSSRCCGPRTHDLCFCLPWGYAALDKGREFAVARVLGNKYGGQVKRSTRREVETLVPLRSRRLSTITFAWMVGKMTSIAREYCKFVSSKWTTDNWVVFWLLVFWRVALQGTTRFSKVFF